jgi:hypothetical protein
VGREGAFAGLATVFVAIPVPASPINLIATAVRAVQAFVKALLLQVGDEVGGGKDVREEDIPEAVIDCSLLVFAEQADVVQDFFRCGGI